MGDHLSEMAILATQHALDPSVAVTPLQARMTFVFMMPFLFLGPFAGALADRLPRRWLMIGADVGRAVLLLMFAVLINLGGRYFGSDWGPFLPLGIVGVLAAVFSPSRSAMVPVLVPAKELVSANAMISGLGLIATFTAGIIGGALAARGLVRTAFNLDAVTFVCSGVLVFLIRTKDTASIGDDRVRVDSLVDSVRGGFRYIAGHGRVVQLLCIAAVFWFAGATVRSVIPAIVKNVYEKGYQEMAMFPAWLGLGLATGAVLITILGHALRSEATITWALFGTGVGVCCLAGTVFIGFEPPVAHILGAMSVFVMGVFGVGISISYNALLQRFVPNQYRGRVYGILNVATVGALLIATGALAIPRWENLDEWAGFLLIGIAALLFVTGGIALATRMKKSSAGFGYTFFRNIDEVFIKVWYRFERLGPCRIPRSGPVIVASNHGCPIDPLLVQGACNYRSVSFMIAAEYVNIPLASILIGLSRCIPVRRWTHDIKATKMAMRRLRDGDAIGVFVEGGIHATKKEDQLKRGVALLAIRTGATVIPVHISGTRNHKTMLRSIVARHRARLVFGPPVDLSQFSGRKGREALDGATRAIFAAINDLAPDK